MNNPQLKFMTPFVAPPTYFESDGVHLNSEAGVTFVQFLVTNCDILFPTDSAPISAPGPTQAASSPLEALSETVDLLRSDVLRRRLQDNLIFARIKEDRDHEINRSREDRCTLSGLSIRTAPPSEPRERKEFFRQFVSDLVSEACPDIDPLPKVLDVIVNMRSGRGPPYFEVKMDSVASSSAFRIAASKLAKANTGSFAGVFVSNTVNMSTRIRIDIMKLIAKKLTTTSELAYVQGFSSRPTLYYRMKDDPESTFAQPVTPGTGRSYSFMESVGRWGDLLRASTLEPIRRKALQSFQGCLEQYFVVLSDDITAEPEEEDIFSKITSGQGRGGRGRGRGRGRPFNPRRSRNIPGQNSNFTQVSASRSLAPWASASSASSNSSSAVPAPVSVPALKRTLDSGDDVVMEGTPTKKKT